MDCTELKKRERKKRRSSSLSSSSLSSSPHRSKRRRRKRQRSVSSSSSDSSSDSSNSSSRTRSRRRRHRRKRDSTSSSSAEEKARRKKRRRKERRRRKHSDSDSSDQKIRKRKKREKEKDKSEKAKKKRKVTGADTAVTDQWGKYGQIQDCDLWAKRQEFQMWLLEVKHQALEGLSSWEEKLLFGEYKEDFNTATLPHKKYYNLEAWEARQSRKGEKKMPKRPAAEMTGFNDESLRREEIKAIRDQRKVHDLRETYQTMKEDSEKVDAMRHQAYLKTQMSNLFKMGRNEEAAKIQQLLQPDEA